MAIESVAAGKILRGRNDEPVAADVRVKSLQPTELAPWVRFSVTSTLIAFAALTAIGIVRTFTTVPRWDDWDGSLEFFANVSEGHWQAWFAQFAEQRPVLPRLVIWTDLKFFGGHFIFQHISGLGFAIALWLVFLLVTRALIKERALGFMIGAMITLLLSSWIQIPNFGVPFNGIHWFTVTFFALSTLVATARAKDNRFRILFSCILWGRRSCNACKWSDRAAVGGSTRLSDWTWANA